MFFIGNQMQIEIKGNPAKKNKDSSAFILLFISKNQFPALVTL